LKDLRQVERTTGATPKELLDAPELWPENESAWNCWLLLNDFRTPGTALALADVGFVLRVYQGAMNRAPTQMAVLEKIRSIENEWRKKGAMNRAPTKDSPV
jgi:hypothetical protein